MTHLLQTSQALSTFLRFASASAARSLCDTRGTWGLRSMSLRYAGEPLGRGLASEPGVDIVVWAGLPVVCQQSKVWWPGVPRSAFRGEWWGAPRARSRDR